MVVLAALVNHNCHNRFRVVRGPTLAVERHRARLRTRIDEFQDPEQGICGWARSRLELFEPTRGAPRLSRSFWQTVACVTRRTRSMTLTHRLFGPEGGAGTRPSCSGASPSIRQTSISSLVLRDRSMIELIQAQVP
jgi:hypothetical protein